MKHLNEYANDFLINDDPFAFESYYDSVFKKVDIYNKNTRLISEGKYTTLPTHITYSNYEQAAISEMLFGMQFKYLYNALSDVCQLEINEGIGDIADKMKDALSKGKEAFTNYIKELIDKIPSNIKEAYDKLGEIAEKGITNAKDFMKKLFSVFKSIGDNLDEVLEKLGLYKKEVIDEIPDSESNEIIDQFGIGNENKSKILKFLVSQTLAGVNNKSVVRDFSISDDSDVNEGLGKKLATAAGIGGLLVAPGTTLLVLGAIVGSILLYKGTIGVGKFLSKKLEPYLLSDKVKATVEKMYNNKIIRYGLGLKISDQSNEEMSGLRKLLKMVHSILINIVISSLIITALTICVGFLLGAASNPITVSIIVGAIVAGKNIFATIVNRILNFKKTTTKKDGTEVENYFFDFMTMFSILSSVVTFLFRIPAVKDWFNNLWDKLCGADFGPSSVMAAERPGKNGFYDEDGNFVEVKGFRKNWTMEKDGIRYVRHPKNNWYYTIDKNGNITPVSQDQFGHLAEAAAENGKHVFLPDGIDVFESNVITNEKTDILNNVKNWSGVKILGKTITDEAKKTLTNSTGEISNEYSKIFMNGNISLQFITTTDGNVFVNVVGFKNTEILKSILINGSTETFNKYKKEAVHLICNIKDIGLNIQIDGVGAQYDAFSKVYNDPDTVSKILEYAAKHGAKHLEEFTK